MNFHLVILHHVMLTFIKIKCLLISVFPKNTHKKIRPESLYYHEIIYIGCINLLSRQEVLLRQRTCRYLLLIYCTKICKESILEKFHFIVICSTFQKMFLYRWFFFQIHLLSENRIFHTYIINLFYSQSSVFFVNLGRKIKFNMRWIIINYIRNKSWMVISSLFFFMTKTKTCRSETNRLPILQRKFNIMYNKMSFLFCKRHKCDETLYVNYNAVSNISLKNHIMSI